MLPIYLIIVYGYSRDDYLITFFKVNLPTRINSEDGL